MTSFDQRLHSVNSRINRYHACEHMIFMVAAWMVVWILLTALDVWLRPRGFVRISMASILSIIALVNLVWIVRLLVQKRSTAAVAAYLEKKFPQLDNHLINRVLFATESKPTAWLSTYMNEGVPMLDTLALTEMKNAKLRKYGAIAVFITALILIVPSFILGDAWTVAMRRMVNPFSQLSPPTFAKVIEVLPANKTIIQGDGIDLMVKVTGRAGQLIYIDLYPSDDKRSTVLVGEIKTTSKEETFSYRVSKVSSRLDYRFTVGDAYPTDKYAIQAVPPLALNTLQVKVTPPKYTGLIPATFNALTNALIIPASSEAAFTVICNRDITQATLTFDTNEVALTSADKKSWSGTRTFTSSGAFTVTAKDTLGLELKMPFRYEVVNDLSPNVQLIAPTARKPVLPVNVTPTIMFEIADDYGLKTVTIERVKRGAKPSDEGEVLKSWTVDGKKKFGDKWTGSVEDLDLSSALRVVAYDNAETPNRSVGPLILLDNAMLSSQLKSGTQSRAEMRKTLTELVKQQKEAYDSTTKLQAELPTFDDSRWAQLATQQKAVRDYALTLAKNKDALIGASAAALSKALQGPFPEATAYLNRMTTGTAETRTDNATKAVAAQKLILTILRMSDEAQTKGEIAKSAAGVAAMLEAIRKTQTENLRITQKQAQGSGTSVPQALIDRQDSLAADTEAMINYCRTEAKASQNENEFIKIMTQIADKTVELKIHTDMLQVSEQMDSDNFKSSIPTQISVTNNIATVMTLLKEWRDTSIKEQEEEASAIVKDAKQALKKMEDIQLQIVDALRNTGSQGDKTGKIDADTLEEILELKANMADAMLKVATDLQALPELESANELVTDTYQTYEEMKQQIGETGTNAVTELGLQKEDWLLETIAETGKKADEMEFWLMAEADKKARNTEQFDKEELPTVGQVTMPEELQDIIGDLLEQEKEEMDKADDSVTNQGMSNPDPGWGIAEGETVDYSAAGKSGNERPEHKDQDGRSQVGRQGMSDGEVMARSGKINEGDNNLDKRRTQDSSQSGDVEEEGHSNAVASGGGKNSGYSDKRGMEGDKNAVRRDTKVESQDSAESTKSMFTRNAETLYGQASKNGLNTHNLKSVIALGRARDNAIAQKANPAAIAEFTTNIVKELTLMKASLETGASTRDMGAATQTDAMDETVTASSPDEAPPEFRDMVSDYFKALGEMN